MKNISFLVNLPAVILMAALSALIGVSGCKENAALKQGDMLRRLKVVAEQARFEMLSAIPEKDSLLISCDNLEKVGRFIESSQKNMRITVTPSRVSDERMVDLSTARVYLIYEGNGWFDTYLVWPMMSNGGFGVSK